MIAIKYFGAGLFVLLAGTANVLFAMQLGHGQVDTAFWIGVAVASATWTVCGLDAVAAQRKAGNHVRACAASMLLCCALGYDVLAAYGLSRAEQRQATALQDTYASHLADLKRVVGIKQSELAATPAGSPAQAQALMNAVSVQPETCAEVTGANKYSRATADRIRSACERRAEALSAIAAAQTRQRAETALQDAQRRLVAAMSAPPAHDARAELLPAYAVAWAPVLLITAGALLSGFAVGSPQAPRIANATHGDIDATPLQAEVANQPALIDELPVLKLEQLHKASDADIAPLERTPEGYIRGTQRAIAEKLGEKLSSVNRALKHLHQLGRLELDTRNKTAFRFV